MAGTGKPSSKPPMADVADREPSWRHNAYVDYLTEQTGVDVDPKSVQLATTLYKDFVGSEHYANAAQAQEDAKQARLDTAAEARKQKVLDRAAKLQAKAAEVLAAAGLDSEPVDEMAAKRGAKKATPAKKAAPPAPPKPPAPPVRPQAPPSDDGDGF